MVHLVVAAGRELIEEYIFRSQTLQSQERMQRLGRRVRKLLPYFDSLSVNPKPEVIP